MHVNLRKIASLYILILCTSTLWSQVARGTYPYGTFDKKGFDTINVGNLNTRFAVPILSKAGRGGMNLYYNLSYDGSVWYPTGVAGSQLWQPSTATWGWTSDSNALTGALSYSSISRKCFDDPPGWYWSETDSNFSYIDTKGVEHDFGGSVSSCDAYGSSDMSRTAADGSGIRLSASVGGGTIYYPDGRVVEPGYSISDRNGNEFSITSGGFTDTTGKVALALAGSGTPSSPQTFTYKDAGGNSRTITMTYKAYTVRTAFGCSGVGEYGPLSASLVDTITYPDGSAYHFSYEATPGYSGDVTGRLAGIELPQGGTIVYNYTSGSNGIVCKDGSTAGLTRTLNSDSGSAASTLSYTRTSPNGTGTSHTEVADGLGNHKAYDFVEVSGSYYETNLKIYQGAESGTPVVARNTCYNGAASPCTTATFTLPVSQIDTYKTLDGIATDGTTAKYNGSGMQTEADVYDFGTSSRGALLRKEVWTYGYTVVADAVTEDDVYDGGGNLAGKTVYVYDGTAVTASSGVPQHFTVSSARGNLTSMTQYANSGTSYTSSFTYEDTGSLLTSTVHGATTTYTYDPTFVYNTGPAYQLLPAASPWEPANPLTPPIPAFRSRQPMQTGR